MSRPRSETLQHLASRRPRQRFGRWVRSAVYVCLALLATSSLQAASPAQLTVTPPAGRAGPATPAARFLSPPMRLGIPTPSPVPRTAAPTSPTKSVSEMPRVAAPKFTYFREAAEFPHLPGATESPSTAQAPTDWEPLPIPEQPGGSGPAREVENWSEAEGTTPRIARLPRLEPATGPELSAPAAGALAEIPLSPPELPPYRAPRDGVGQPVAFDPAVFSPTPFGEGIGYDPRLETSVYGGKYLVPTQRPWVELGRGLYQPGPIPPSETWLGEHNLVSQHLLVYGDYRIGSAYNEQFGNEKTIFANRLNLDIDWKITATERIHAFWGPLDQGNNITRFEYDQGDARFFNELDNDLDALFFEGDLGYLWGGATGQDAPFDLPFTVGRLPIFLQNGIWMEDAVTGAAATILARNAPGLGIANYDITFFVGFDDLNTAALPDESVGNVFGVHGFFDMWGGYLETGYGFVDDQSAAGLSYHNVGISFTRRYWQRFSNSLRYLANFGQDPAIGLQTADGHLVLLETTLRTPRPHTMIPYVNLFAGFDRPQSLGRAAGSGGVLRNTGINFETDGLTGYPTLDATAHDTAGGAVGLNMLGPAFDYQLVMEFAWLHALGNNPTPAVPGDQYGLGVRYQLPLTNSLILRMDAMHGFLEKTDDITGARTELRYKF